ncbi:hypothetical protein ACLOJK_019395 [Asimina triloba]
MRRSGPESADKFKQWRQDKHVVELKAEVDHYLEEAGEEDELPESQHPIQEGASLINIGVL